MPSQKSNQIDPYIANEVKRKLETSTNCTVALDTIEELLSKCEQMTATDIFQMVDNFTSSYIYPKWSVANILKYKPDKAKTFVSGGALLSFRAYTDRESNKPVTFVKLSSLGENRYDIYLEATKLYDSGRWAESSFAHRVPIDLKNIAESDLKTISKAERELNAVCVESSILFFGDESPETANPKLMTDLISQFKTI